jgi:DNA modification methylase
MSYRLISGDVRKALPRLEPASLDACLCDPPYGLGFMGKDWDSPGGVGDFPMRRSNAINTVNTGVSRQGGRQRACADFARKQARDARDFQERNTEWFTAILRVLKPGAMLLAFGGTRTWHRLACAIEDAGFELRDTMMWLYGSGFPKSLDVSKAIDKAAGAQREILRQSRHGSGPNQTKLANHGQGDTGIGYMDGSGKVFDVTSPATDAARQWSGYGTALKPAWEPILLAMKPCEGTFAENALQWGVAGLAIDACRIETQDNLNGGAYAKDGTDRHDGAENWRYKREGGAGEFKQPEGRWPANLLLDEEAGAMLDEQSRNLGKSSGGGHHIGGLKNTHRNRDPKDYGDTIGFGDSGGASRFSYCAKASRRERGEGNTHPTVKPLALCEYLARLILPPARETPRRLLVPFAGSGSEMLGALAAGWDEVVGVERSPEYIEINRRRLKGSKGSQGKETAGVVSLRASA